MRYRAVVFISAFGRAVSAAHAITSWGADKVRTKHRTVELISRPFRRWHPSLCDAEGWGRARVVVVASYRLSWGAGRRVALFCWSTALPLKDGK